MCVDEKEELKSAKRAKADGGKRDTEAESALQEERKTEGMCMREKSKERDRGERKIKSAKCAKADDGKRDTEADSALQEERKTEGMCV